MVYAPKRGAAVILLEDGPAGAPALFDRPLRRVVAYDLADVPAALEHLDRARQGGAWRRGRVMRGGGGRQGSAQLAPATVTTLQDSSGQVQVLQPNMDAKLQDGDVVYVRESMF